MKTNLLAPSTAIVLNNKNEILLAKRFYESDPINRYHGYWGLPGGRIEENEQPSETAIRETKEETGIGIAIISNRPIVMSCIEATGNHVIKLAYMAKYVDGKINIKDKGTSDAKWFSQKSVDDLQTTPLTKELIRQAFKIIKTELD
jgi:ADP-ribose pyrophosphatase YjhB (NUDIX family)